MFYHLEIVFLKNLFLTYFSEKKSYWRDMRLYMCVHSEALVQKVILKSHEIVQTCFLRWKLQCMTITLHIPSHPDLIYLIMKNQFYLMRKSQFGFRWRSCEPCSLFSLLSISFESLIINPGCQTFIQTTMYFFFFYQILKASVALGVFAKLLGRFSAALSLQV